MGVLHGVMVYWIAYGIYQYEPWFPNGRTADRLVCSSSVMCVRALMYNYLLHNNIILIVVVVVRIAVFIICGHNQGLSGD